MIDTRSPVSRRQFSRLLAGGSLAVVAGGLATVATAKPASAGRSWCKMDPEFRINGKKLHVYLYGPDALHQAVTGPSPVTLYIPSNGVEAEFVWADEGFGGRGYTVQIIPSTRLVIDPSSGAIPVEVEAFVPSSTAVGIEAESVQDLNGKKIINDSKKGTTNTVVLVKAKLK